MMFKKLTTTALLGLTFWIHGGLYQASCAWAHENATAGIESRFNSMPSEKKISFVKHLILRLERAEKKISCLSDSTFDRIVDRVTRHENENLSPESAQRALANQLSTEEADMLGDLAIQAPVSLDRNSASQALNKKSILEMMRGSLTNLQSVLSKLQGSDSNNTLSYQGQSVAWGIAAAILIVGGVSLIILGGMSIIGMVPGIMIGMCCMAVGFGFLANSADSSF